MIVLLFLNQILSFEKGCDPFTHTRRQFLISSSQITIRYNPNTPREWLRLRNHLPQSSKLIPRSIRRGFFNPFRLARLGLHMPPSLTEHDSQSAEYIRVRLDKGKALLPSTK